MRLTPSQLAMMSLTGKKLPRGFQGDIKDRIWQAYKFLIQITSRDFGFEIELWDKHLRETDEGGYTFENNNSWVYEELLEGSKSIEWQKAVSELKEEHGIEENTHNKASQHRLRKSRAASTRYISFRSRLLAALYGLGAYDT